jgi:uncharacterized protein YdaU (DUF1376 family)
VNYYEHHLGDYMRDTAHLSILEDGVYRRLIDAYYIKELPIPAALRDAYRLVRAVSKPERDAVQAVLREFFEEAPTGWRHKRCEAEIARFQEKRAKAQRSAQARWGAPQSQSDRNANASSDGNANASDAAMRTHDERNAPTHHTPHTSHQTPDIETGDNTRPDPESTRVSMVGAVCIALKSEGIGSCNPGHPDLAVLIEQGAEVQNFVSAARTARDKGKGFAYVLGIVKGQLAEARALATAGRTTTGHLNGSSGGQARAARMAEASPNLTRRPKQAGETFDMEPSDVTPRRLG